MAFIISSSLYEYNDGIQHNTSSTLVSSVFTKLLKHATSYLCNLHFLRSLLLSNSKFCNFSAIANAKLFKSSSTVVDATASAYCRV